MSDDDKELTYIRVHIIHRTHYILLPFDGMVVRRVLSKDNFHLVTYFTSSYCLIIRLCIKTFTIQVLKF